jgi:hypothetical protein
MRFNHPNQISLPSGNYNGFTPLADQSLIFAKDASGNTVIVTDPKTLTPESYSQDLSELRARIESHNWYYHLHNDIGTYNSGYHNEQAILQIVQRRGGIFKTIWETERRRHLSAV